MTSTSDLSVFCAVGAVRVWKHFNSSTFGFGIGLRFCRSAATFLESVAFFPISATAALRLRLTAHHSLVWGNEEFEAELTPNIEQEGI